MISISLLYDIFLYRIQVELCDKLITNDILVNRKSISTGCENPSLVIRSTFELLI